ncbi:MAG: hypothetical protein UR39_C0002G0158 [Candidatus Woesebacteria bacterium GW2011_GWA1_33_30]|uniref:Uncharacterized protein n=1 Tax=Candidatus Woesebacteria bacterium GW2011_GWA2_33_28 TaxID=1618561 RepID=A0A0G0CA36_9BACT|nr:MAG: hypothetical protein UR38_C0002G0158 [Candidatus Woesebacteria bacterium GW2011_GWA2_33_28]KKP48868.1 MAG: hypothetical protein UR39_C0002G0158 [Candidatus Woesebacteria bacterium GW2011_GWA1_33_30]KKP50141.1 MAG: hypothetical protein UR40_C0002G0158 [Microgenomates group bacterium GW2011_GWC1_33_32]KKP51911.1 MAG: hypothetical protein UR44_C0006G0157 [Candidatus Woesebacteria bacterium GW2011_GWB1_33_38]KKP57347.1 MAG: hypothetical protein UR48_C0019G0015 [Microgenomates group bacteriu
MKDSIKNCKGQSLFEVILALFIISMIIVAVVILSTKSISNSLSSRNKTLASKYTQELVEWLRKQKEIDYGAFKNHIISSNIYCYKDVLDWSNSGACTSGETIGTTIFRREAQFLTETVAGKSLITANVVTFWDDSRGIHEAKTVTYFTDTRDQ